MTPPAARAPLVLAAVLLLALAGPSTAIVPVTYHPFPDDADPLGFPYQGGRDAFVARHAWRFEGIPPYPYIVIDGVLEIKGIPDNSDPMASTRRALDEAIERREAEPVPVLLRLDAQDGGGSVEAVIEISPINGTSLGGDVAGRIWVGLMEDHVFFRPPQAVSNGVEDHRFTLRAVRDLGAIQVGEASVRTVRFDTDPSWAADRLEVVAWVEADSSGLRFASREVLQSARDPVGGEPTLQVERGVLVEMLSATWCPPCIYGDTAVAELAGGERPPAPTYVDGQIPPWWVWLVAVAVAVAVAWRRL